MSESSKTPSQIKQAQLEAAQANTQTLLESVQKFLKETLALGDEKVDPKKVKKAEEEIPEQSVEVAANAELSRWDLGDLLAMNDTAAADSAANASAAAETGAASSASAFVASQPMIIGLAAVGLAGGGGGGGASAAGIGVTVTQSVNDTGADKVITLTFEFAEDVENFTADDVAVVGGTKASALGGDGLTTFTLDVTSSDADTAVSFSLAAGAATGMADGTGSAAVSGSFDLAGPELAGISTNVDGQQIILTFNEDVAFDDTDLTVFTLDVDGATETPTSASVDGNTITLTFAGGSFAEGNTLGVSYYPDATADVLEDTKGNDFDLEGFSVSSGSVADGRIKGASITLELDDGSVIDAGINTDASGYFFLLPNTLTEIANVMGAYSLIASGGYNVDTGIQNTQDMRAPGDVGSTVLNPLTTLIDLTAKSITTSTTTLTRTEVIDAAQNSVKTSLGISTSSTSINLLTYDAVSKAESSDADGLIIQKAATQVASVVAYSEVVTQSSSASDLVVTKMVEKIVSNYSSTSSTVIALDDTDTLKELTGVDDDAGVTLLKQTVTTISSATSITQISTAQQTLLDKIAPAAPEISLAPDSDTGVKGDGLTSDSSASVRVTLKTSGADGTAVALGDTVKFFVGDATTADEHVVDKVDLAVGYVDFAVTLVDGDNAFTATVVDKAGNVSDLSDEAVIVLDDTVPTIAITTPISDGYRNAAEDDSPQTISGTTDAEDGQKVTLTLNDGTTTVVRYAIANDGTWSYKFSAYDLAKFDEGTVTVTADVYNRVGNAGSDSATYVYDITAPVKPVVALATDSGDNTADGVTNDLALTTPTSIEQGATVEYQINGKAWSETYTAPVADGNYTVNVRQTDSAGNPSELTTLTLKLDDTDPTVTTTAVSADEEQTAVATLKANESVSWALGTGGDNDLFALTTEGVLTFKTAPSYEGDKQSFTVNVVATDVAGNDKAQAITVSLKDINEDPVASSTIADQVVVTGQAYELKLADYFSDVDAKDATLTYSVVSGDLPADITFASGVISGTTDSTADTRDITVRATDSSGKSVEQTFAILAVDAPAIASFSIKDATDDVDTGKAGSALTVVLTLTEAFTMNGADASTTIDLTFGDSTTPVVATYDSHDGDAKTITYTASAPAGDAVSTAITKVTLGDASVVGKTSGQAMITDAYGPANTTYTLDNTVNAPEIALATDSGKADDDGLTNDLTVNVTLDDDVSSWRYSVDGGSSWADGTDSASFELDANAIYAADKIVVEQTDKAGNVSAQTKNTAEITTDTTVPVFISGANVSMDENTTAVASVDAQDINGPDSFSLSGDDADLFDINERGVLTLKTAADFETKASYAVTVDAEDDAGNTASQQITVSVIDVNEAPVAVADVVNVIAVTDKVFAGLDLDDIFSDVDANDSLTYSLESGSNLPPGLAVDATDATLITGTATTEGETTVTVVATDAGGLTVEKDITFNVYDAPVISSVSIVKKGTTDTTAKDGDTIVVTATVSEPFTWTADGTDGDPTVRLDTGNTTTQESIVATYVDHDESAKTITYEAVLSGDYDTDELTVDYIDLELYSLVGTISGQPLDVTSMPATVSFVIDNTAPDITSGDTGSGSLTEETDYTDQVVYTAAATDTASVTFSLKSGAPSSLSIDGSTGEVTYSGKEDYETAQSVDFTVVATDTAGNASEKLVSVSVTNIDDTAPEFISGDFGVSFWDSFTQEDVILYRAKAIDDNAVTYSLDTASDVYFDIDSATGVVTADDAAFAGFENGDYLDDEQLDELYDLPADGFTLQVTATDALGTASTKSVTLQTNDVQFVVADADEEDSYLSSVVTKTADGFKVTYSLNEDVSLSGIQAFNVEWDSTLNAPTFAVLNGWTSQANFTGGSGNATAAAVDFSLQNSSGLGDDLFELTFTFKDGENNGWVELTDFEYSLEDSTVISEADDSDYHFVNSASATADDFFSPSSYVGSSSADGIALFGQATATGGVGPDVFYILDHVGLEATITDFEPGVDVISISEILYDKINNNDATYPNYQYLQYMDVTSPSDGHVYLAEDVDATTFKTDYGFTWGEGDSWQSTSTALDNQAGGFFLSSSTGGSGKSNVAVIFVDTNSDAGVVEIRSKEIQLDATASGFSSMDVVLSTPYIVTGTSGDDVIDMMEYGPTNSDLNSDDPWDKGVIAYGGDGNDVFSIVEPHDMIMYRIVDFTYGEDTIDATRALTADADTYGVTYDSLDVDGASSAITNVGRKLDVDIDALQTQFNTGDPANKAYDYVQLDGDTTNQSLTSDQRTVLETLDNGFGWEFYEEENFLLVFADVEETAGLVDIEVMGISFGPDSTFVASGSGFDDANIVFNDAFIA